MQAPAIQKMGAEVTQHNNLLQQIATSFPSNHSGSSVYVYDFGAAFTQAGKSSSEARCMLHSSFSVSPVRC